LKSKQQDPAQQPAGAAGAEKTVDVDVDAIVSGAVSRRRMS